MERKLDGGPAFPGDANDWGYRGGMSLRDYFAGQAMTQGMAVLVGMDQNLNDYQLGRLAKIAYLAADEMLKAREARDENALD